MSRLCRLIRSVSLALMLACVAAAPSRAASRYDSALRFRTLTTRHFYIHFHQGEDRLAQRLAAVAEAVHDELALRLQTSVGGRTHVVLADQDDLANGFATPFPYNAVQIVAGPPASSTLIGNTDDWLRLVFVHEYTHILHFDRAESLARGLRLIFGRAPLVFPNATQPLWQMEGLATYEETQVTGRGRMVAGDFQSLLAEPRRAGRFEPLDRANGGLAPWPAGQAPYAYGGFFYRYLSARFGEDSIARLSRTTSRGYYFLPGLAFRKVFHEPLGQVWRDYARAYPAATGDGESSLREPTRVTYEGFQVASPRFLREGASIATRHGRVTSPGLVYSVQNADDYPLLMAVPANGTGRPQAVIRRYGGESMSSDGRGFIFDQLDLSRSVALKSDLYRLDPASRRVTRLTRDARLVAPDVSPDASLLACIRVIDAARTLAVFHLATIEAAGPGHLPDPVFALREVDAQFDSPRWSPDGKRIAAVRWRLGGASELIVIDMATRQVTALATSATGRHVSPAWCPDGRTIVFASDREGGEFALYAAEAPQDEETGAAPARVFRVARVRGGALSPDVSPDGRSILFVGYTTAGYDLFTLPLDRETWAPVDSGTEAGARPVVPATAAAAAGPSSALQSSPYSPLRMLVPRYWLPDFRSEDGLIKAGISTSSGDILGRHSFTASAVWRMSGGSRDEPFGGRPDWSASYVYDRWRPAFFARGSEKLSFLAVQAQPGEAPARDAELSELTAETGIRLSLLSVRRAQLWQVGVATDRRSLETADVTVSHYRNAVRLAWAFNSANVFGFSVSPEEGFAIGVTTELTAQALGADGNARSYTAEVRAYPRLGGRHAILALRAGAGTSAGDQSVRRIFYLGGSGSAGSLIDFGSGALSMLRGFSPLMFAGYHSAVANIDYRRPLLRLDRGVSWLPVMVRVIHGALFVDAGNVWRRTFSINDTKVSVGGEAAVDVVAGYTLPLTLAAGVAWTRNGRFSALGGPTFYFRLGRAF